MAKKDKELLFSLTKSDFRWDYYKGRGKGGQKKNKTENCCRCTHPPSKAVGKSEEGRSKIQNTKRAFIRMTQTKEFKNWIRLEVARVTGELENIRKKVDRELENIVTEIRKDNKWTKVDPKELS